MYILFWALIVTIAASSVMSVVFSFKSRRSADLKSRGVYAARTNICMGITLILLAFVQMLMFSGSTLRLIVGAVFLLLGLFNLFAGMRNHSIYRAMKG